MTATIRRPPATHHPPRLRAAAKTPDAVPSGRRSVRPTGVLIFLPERGKLIANAVRKKAVRRSRVLRRGLHTDARMPTGLQQRTDAGEYVGSAFLQGGGELGALIRSHDWSRTPLGTPTRWPQSLK